jgi:cold shock CspA family protein
MVFDRIFNRDDKDEEETPPTNNKERCEGKIYHLSDEGWGFISSHDIPFTRIYFHWTGLSGDTLKFTELKKGDRVEFNHIQVKNESGQMQDRAIKIKVL